MRRVQWGFSWCWGESEVWEETATCWPCYLSLQVIFGSLDRQCHLVATCWVWHCSLPVANSWKVHSGEAKDLQESEAYNYFVSDWVGTWYYHKINSEFCIIKPAVRPSQQLSEKPHHPWVGLRQKNGDSCCFSFVKAGMISFALRSATFSAMKNLGLPLLHLLAPACQENCSVVLVLYQIHVYSSTPALW